MQLARTKKVQIEIERFVTAWVEGQRGALVPGVHALAARFHTSTRIVSAVLHRMQEEGLIEIGRRRGIRAASAQVKSDPGVVRPAKTAGEHLADRILADIERGVHSVGQSLPKIEFLAKSNTVSGHTVSNALVLLEARGVIHRRMRGFAVGPRSLAGNRVILCCQGNGGWWESTFGHDWFASFSLAFMRETVRSGTQVLPVFWSIPAHPFQTHGKDAIEQLILHLAERYAGTLVAGQTWDYESNQQVQLGEMVAWLCQFERPVVWFDAIDEISNRGLLTDSKYRQACNTPLAKKWFTRCHFDQERGVKCALENLYQLGHRRVLVPVFEQDTLAQHRLPALEMAQKGLRGLQLRVAEFGPLSPEQAGGVAQTPQTKTIAQKAKQAEVTAVLALNDMQAALWYRELSTAGVRIPQDLSLVSFDNVPRLNFPWQISSVDFGFGELAYVAFHLMIQDIAIERRGINFAPRCTLNHKGSLAATPRERQHAD